MKTIKMATRKSFIKYSAFVSLFLFAGPALIRKVYSALTVKHARTTGTYKHDKNMKFRKSQDNPMIKQIYKDFLEHPNSHKAHELLHTEYVDRSAKIKALMGSGIKLNLSD